MHCVDADASTTMAELKHAYALLCTRTHTPAKQQPSTTHTHTNLECVPKMASTNFTTQIHDALQQGQNKRASSLKCYLNTNLCF